ncbi:MAG TPA: prolyl oligopeptidase family serine peptidase, partial [Thermoanaerobaculia bacterium]|nr:prolyl oligopeptidase family serine peptidase [Thermoanaerobaculia bacterium]
MRLSTFPARFWFGLFSVLLLGGQALAQPVDAGASGSPYRTPPQVLVDLVDAPPTPGVSVDPKQEWMLLLEQPNLPPIAELAERELRLAGLRIRPQINGPSRTNSLTGLELLRISDLSRREITGLPAEPRIENTRWSPDGRRIAFTNTVEDGIELWVAEVETGQARRLLPGRLNLSARISPRWLIDSRTLVVTLVPEGRGPEPQASTVPAGPVVQENLGRTAPARTYQDLLKNAQDERLFEYYLTSQVAKVTVDGEVTPLGDPGLIGRIALSPDSRYLLVETLHRPFSYLVPADRFPRKLEVWDLDGHRVRQIADLPLQEEIPISFDSVATGPRDLDWRDDAPATLVWAEALDGGDASKEATERDRLFLLPAPFTGDPVPLATLGYRFVGAVWGDDNLALVYENWWKTRRTRTWRVRPGAGKSSPELLFDLSSEDRYNDPGFPETRFNEWGRPVLLTAKGGKSIFLLGEGASSEGDRPFLDTLDLATKKTQRLFRSEAPFYEQPLRLMDPAGKYLLVRRESVEEPPNYFLRDLEKKTLRQITSFPHPTPQLLGIQKELIRYKRADGVDLTATLYLPKGYKPADGPLPTVMWAYPQEFKSADAAGQVTDSPYRFDRVSWASPLVWLTEGYAVLDNPTMPIIGEGDKEPNDTYIDQLVASAQAAVDEVVRRGVTDRNRIAIGGHSYGAFMTANLLAHSDLFAAGIARSGAYNRTLTPFGFQAEERDLWKAPETYIRMSPFMYANKVNEPILLIHGQADNNSGTDPIQSERFYNA